MGAIERRAAQNENVSALRISVNIRRYFTVMGSLELPMRQLALCGEVAEFRQVLKQNRTTIAFDLAESIYASACNLASSIKQSELPESEAHPRMQVIYDVVAMSRGMRPPRFVGEYYKRHLEVGIDLTN